MWLYYDTRLFTASRVPPATGFNGSSEIHSLYGLCKDTQAAQLDGPLKVRGLFDACDACMDLNLAPGACEMRSEFGNYRLEYAVRAPAGPAPSTTRSDALEVFAGSLCKDQVVAVPSNHMERLVEGCLWFAKLSGKALLAPADEMQCLQQMGTRRVHGL